MRTAYLIVVLACYRLHVVGAQTTTRPIELPPAEAAFRTQVMVVSETAQTRVHLTASESLGANPRAELTRLLDEFERKVDAQAEQIRANPPEVFELIKQADTMGSEFSENPLNKWREANPEAQVVLEKAAALYEAIIDTFLNDRQQLITAASRAGLPEAKRAQAQEMIDATYRSYVEFAKEIGDLQQNGARLPANDPRRYRAMTIIAENEIEKMRAARTIRDKLREFLPPDRRQALDEALMKLGEGQ
jgi:hypothetical protein